MFKEKTLTERDIELIREKYKEDLEEQIKKVKENYPVQYLIGNVDFLNTNILVNENVLIPRFETEYLCEKILQKIDKTASFNCLDIGTGSGCIAIILAKNTKCKVTGIDISKSALKVAKENSIRNTVSIKLIQKDILTGELEENYDIIISNPPYVDKLETVDETTKYEPQNALFAEHNGLIFYEEILKKIKNKPKLIAFEIGEKQGNTILNLAKKKFPEAKITLEKDLCKKDRYIFIEQE